MALLARWNRLALVAWMLAPAATVSCVMTLFSRMRIHGGPAGDATWLRIALTSLSACGFLGLLAALGVGCGRGRRPRGRVLGALLVPAGLWAGRALWLDVQHYGWS